MGQSLNIGTVVGNYSEFVIECKELNHQEITNKFAFLYNINQVKRQFHTTS